MRWASWRRRGALGASCAAVLAPAVLLASAPLASASAFDVLPIRAVPGTVAELLAMTGVATGTSAAAGVTGVASTAAVGTGVVVGEATAGLAVAGIAIGYVGTKGVQLAWRTWFGQGHPIVGSNPGGLGPFTFNAGGDVFSAGWSPIAGQGSKVHVTISPPGNGQSNYSLVGRCVGGVTRFSVTNGNEFYPPDMGPTACPNGAEVLGQSNHGAAAAVPYAINLATGPSGYVGVSEVDCMDVATGAVTTITRETPVAGADADTTSIPDAICPTGSRAVGARVKIRSVNSSGATLDTWTTNSWEPDPSVFSPQGEYADCIVAEQPCELRPVTADGGTYSTAPNPSTGLVADPARCMWGPHSMPLADCDPMIQEVTDPAPTPTATAPPESATPQSCVADAASADCAADRNDAGRCWPSGWGVINPLEWIVRPAKCLFIPAPGTFEAGWSRVTVDWCTTAPGALSCAVGDVFGPFGQLGDLGDDGGCEGVAVTLPNLLDRSDDGVIHPLSACSDAAKAVQSFWIPFSTGAVYLGSVMLGARMVSKTIGADDAVPS